MFLRASVFVTVVIVEAIYLNIGRFRLLLMALGRWALRFLVPVLGRDFVLPLVPLSLGRMSSIEGARFAVGTRVIEFFPRSIINTAGVKTFDMLPRIARLAVNCISIVVRVVADTLDRVWLLLY